MGQRQVSLDNRRFGRYLRGIREDRRLSLDAVEEMTLSYPEPVTKSHLSRIENGQAVPTFPRMFALSQVYGVPIAFLAEKFETDLHRGMVSVDLSASGPEAVLQQLQRHKVSGNYLEGLSLAAAALEREKLIEAEPRSEHANELRLFQINCLVHLKRYESAKVECEELLSHGDLPPRQKFLAFLSYANCCYRLGRHTFAKMALESADRELSADTRPPRLTAIAESTRGAVYFALARLQDAVGCFERAATLFRSVPDPFELCKAQINLARALIEMDSSKKATTYLRKAMETAEKSGYDRLRALALGHLAVVCFRRDEHEAAETYALRSNSIARTREYHSIVFRNCYYLQQIAAARDDEAAVKSNGRTLRALLGRVEPDLPEAEAYRARQARTKP